MNPAQQTVLSPREVARILVVHARRWLVPAAVVGLLAVVYAAARPATWEASQALIVRNEAVNNQGGPGKFGGTDEMKTVQETILELVKSRGVLSAALKEVGPPANYKKEQAAWPTARDVAKVRKTIKLAPPKGAEFGKTEVFYLKVKSQDRTRAVALAAAVVDELKTRFQRLLDDRAASMIEELKKTVALAEADLENSTGKLAQLEGGVGGDLAELRILHESPAGSSDLRQKVVAVEEELRQAKTDRRDKTELLSLLKTGPSDAGRLQALPNRLLESHATLRRLSEGLSTARLNACNLLSKMSEYHPLVRAAEAEKAEILHDLNNELRNAIHIAEVELRLADGRVESLQDQLADVRGRFDRLAGLRARYANLVAQTKNRTDLLETARRTLADARAAQAAARAASRIARIDHPDTGTRPVGPSRAMIVLFGLIGGLFAGWGILFMTVETPPPAGLPAPAVDSSPVAQAPSAPRNGNGRAEKVRPSLPSGSELSLKQALAKVSQDELSRN